MAKSPKSILPCAHTRDVSGHLRFLAGSQCSRDVNGCQCRSDHELHHTWLVRQSLKNLDKHSNDIPLPAAHELAENTAFHAWPITIHTCFPKVLTLISFS